MDVRLEPLTETHLGDIDGLLGDPGVLRFTRVPVPVPDGFAGSWIGRYAAARPAGTADGFAALDPEGRFVGLGLVPHVDAAAGEAELGYIVAPGARGRGAGRAILEALTRWALDERGLQRVYLIIDVDNRASQTVATRAGYVREGVMRSQHVKQGVRADCELWSFLPSDRGPRFPSGRIEPTARWIRVKAGDTWIADTRRALLVVRYGPGRLPTYAIPEADVRTDLLGADAQRILDDHWTFTWDQGVRWFEEAEEVHVHARDPQKRVDALPSTRHVRISVEGETLAESDRPVALFETGLPPRWYLPAEDVRLDLLAPTDTATRCPYKGTAAYRSFGAHDDLAWSYAEPLPAVAAIRDRIAFFDERIDLELDGVAQERPRTPWSRR
jgi:uncharacterized protein (DUF427 family)/RimJ/RimL family protein N-acetyltransferase